MKECFSKEGIFHEYGNIVSSDPSKSELDSAAGLDDGYDLKSSILLRKNKSPRIRGSRRFCQRGYNFDGFFLFCL